MGGNKLMKMRSTQPEEATHSYNGMGGDRSVTNRTPLLEHYHTSTNQGSLTRAPQVTSSYATTNANSHHINQSTSVPRPTIASELKLLKEQSRGSPPGGHFDMVSSYQSSAANQSGQFIQGNSLANFMWNKQPTAVIPEASAELEQQSR
jgi:hypothetical protein